MIRTGLHRLDELLSGGIPGGVIVDIFGAHGTGKTQMLMQLTANVAAGGRGGGYDDGNSSSINDGDGRDYDVDEDDDNDNDGHDAIIIPNGNGRDFGYAATSATPPAATATATPATAPARHRHHRVLYIDTTGGFRPERILEIQPGPAADLLERITVYRPTNTSEQMGAVRGLDAAGFSMVAIDNVTDLFSYEYGRDGGIESIHERNMLFARHMRGLSEFAITNNVPVILTNMVRYTTADDREVENMGNVIDPFTHIKIRLFRDQMSGLGGRLSWALGGGSFPYRIRTSGLSDPGH